MDWAKDFAACFPVKERRIGLELEFPLVTQDGEAATWEQTTAFFRALNWQAQQQDGMLIGMTKKIADYPVCINTDVGCATVEVTLPPCTTLEEVEQHLIPLLQEMAAAATHCGLHLLLYGIQPSMYPTTTSISPKARNHALRTYFPSAHHIPEGDFLHMTLTASYQVHIDVSQEEAMDVLAVYNGFTPALIALCANSPVWHNKDTGMRAFREYCWDLLHDPRGTYEGILPPMQTLEEYVALLLNMPPILTKRNNVYYAFTSKTFHEFATHGATVHDLQGKKQHMTATFDDFVFHSSAFWFDARLKPEFGTVELRCCDPQPLDAQLAPAACALGLLTNLAQAKAHVAQYTHEELCALRLAAITHGIDDKHVCKLATTMLALAGESPYLAPFKERLAQKRTPAHDVLDVWKKDGVAGIVAHTALRF